MISSAWYFHVSTVLRMRNYFDWENMETKEVMDVEDVQKKDDPDLTSGKQPVTAKPTHDTPW